MGPVDPVGVCTVGVVSDPARFDSARVKFEPVPEWTQIVCPHSGTLERSGFSP